MSKAAQIWSSTSCRSRLPTSVTVFMLPAVGSCCLRHATYWASSARSVPCPTASAIVLSLSKSSSNCANSGPTTISLRARPHASVSVTWRRLHSPVSGQRQQTPGAAPKMCGTRGGAIRNAASEARCSHKRRHSASGLGASSTAQRNDPHGRVASCTMTAAFAVLAAAVIRAVAAFTNGPLSGPHMPRRVPFGKSSTSSRWTQNELFTSSRSFVICPATASEQSITPRARLLGLTVPKPPFSTNRAPIQSGIVPAW
eukprot:scaffold18385_cov42-Phaeocystis_antarctica.AAC.5